MKKNYILPLALSLALAASCSEPKPDIPEDEFAEIVYQIHRADAILYVKGINDNNFKNDTMSYYNDVFIKAGITRKQFNEAIQWYLNHPKQYKDLYDIVIKKVSQMEQDEAKRYEVKADRDSNDVWTMRSDWNLPLDGETNPLAFNRVTFCNTNCMLNRSSAFCMKQQILSIYLIDMWSFRPYTAF